MVEAIMSIALQLGLAIKQRYENKAQFVDQMLIPLYEKLAIVHAGYLDMFTRCRISLVEGDPITKAYRELTILRIKEEPLRREIIGYVELLAQRDDLARFEGLLKAVKSYFYVFDINQTTTNGSYILREMEKYVSGADDSEVNLVATGGRTFEDQLLPFVERVLYVSRSQWEVITRLYLEAKGPF